MSRQALAFAARALSTGNLPASEILCRDILDADPLDASALNMLGIVAARVGMLGHSVAHFEAALKARPSDAKIRRNLDKSKYELRRYRPENTMGPRYLLIKSWGSGFWSDISHVLGCLLLAEATGRIPVTHWGKNSLFGNGSDRDAFGLYFNAVSHVTSHDLRCMDGATIFPGKWGRETLTHDDVAKWSGGGSRMAAIYLLNRPETIIVSDFFVGVIDVMPWLPHGHPMQGKPVEEACRYLVQKYLSPNEAVVSACNEFYCEHLEGAPFAAIHLRGSDKIRESRELPAISHALLSALASIDSSWQIFLLTDDDRWHAQIKAAYGKRLVATTCQRTHTATGAHYLPSADRARLGLEVMMDALLALRADRFLGNGHSNVSAMIAVMKDWKPGDCVIVGRSLLTRRNLFIHIKP